MPYKRKAHVVFIGSGDVCRAMLAASLANASGAEWIEARAAALSPPQNNCAWTEIDTAAQIWHSLDQETLAWADLIVTLDEAADKACPPLPPHIQKRCYPFAQPENPVDFRRVRDAIQQRVEGMIGGMRMLTQMTSGR